MRTTSKSRTTTDGEQRMGRVARRMAPIHPGEMLREEFLVPMGLSAHALAMAIQVPATRIAEIVKERRGISGDTALRLARFFRMTPQFWMNVQSHYELEMARDAMGPRAEAAIKPAPVDAKSGALKFKRTA